MEKIWLEQYKQHHIEDHIDLDRYSSIIAVLLGAVQRYAKQPAFSCMGTTLTFQQTDQLSQQIASFLQTHLKLEKGARVALMMPNVLAYPITLLGVLRSGMTAVNVNPLYTPRELEHQLSDAQVDTIFILENFAHTLADTLPKLSIKNIIVISLGDLMKLKGFVINMVARYIKRMVPVYHLPGSITFSDALTLGHNHPYHPTAIQSNDVAFLQYTGGTTGVSKGAMLTHKNIIANILQVRKMIGKDMRLGQELIITALPLYHIFSLTANLMCFMDFGAHNVLITNPRDIPSFIKTMKKYKVTAITGVNTLFNALLNNPAFETIDFSSWRLVLGGGMAVQRSVAERWKKTTGMTLIEAYGLTETSPAVCINPMSQADFNGTIGIPVPVTEIDIRDASGQSLGVDEAGELFVRGPQVMKGYWNRPDETKKVLGNDGFLATGDMAMINKDGFIRLVDRKKDMILVSGFNVYPNEIEEVVSAHPKVQECACVGTPHPKSGEVVKLFVVKKDESLTEDELIAYCRERLTAYKIPKSVVFRDDLPKSNVGKILRRALRDETKTT